MNLEAIVVGVSAGGFSALQVLLENLETLRCPILIVQHVGDHPTDYMCERLNGISLMPTVVADDKVIAEPGHIYIAPPSYHMMLDDDMRISLCVDERICFARPSIDVLFKSASSVCHDHLLGIIMTGANTDGAEGALTIKKNGGKIIAQDPSTAYCPIMPQAAIDNQAADIILALSDIATYLNDNYQLKSEEADCG